MVYNCKVVHFFDGSCQLRFYSEQIHVNDKITMLRNDKREITLESKPDGQTSKEWSCFVSKNRTIKNLYDITRSNKWDYFVTFTLNKNRTDRYNYDDCVKSLTEYLKIIKNKYCKDLKYCFVSEKHKDGAYHFHGVMGNCPDLPVVDSKHKTKNDAIIFNLDKNIYGFSTATKVKNQFAICSYITKYISKDLNTEIKNRKRYICSNNIDRGDITYHRISKDKLKEYLRNNSDNVSYMKTSDFADMSINYIELKKYDSSLEFNKVNLDFEDL